MNYSHHPAAENLNLALGISDARSTRIIAILFAAVAFSKTPGDALHMACQELPNVEESLYAATALTTLVETWNKVPGILKQILKMKGYEGLRDAQELAEKITNARPEPKPRPRPDFPSGGVRVEVVSGNDLGSMLADLIGFKPGQPTPNCDCARCTLLRQEHGPDADIRHRGM